MKNKSCEKIKNFRDIKNEIIKKMNLKLRKINKLNNNVDNSNNIIEGYRIEHF